jgi:EAL domain-containing protein (putative c-di-GMP-specific phosphodiesterase class I)
MPLLEALNAAGSAPADRPELIQRMLRSVREHLGMEVAYVSEFVADDSVFRVVDAPGLEAMIKPGDSRSLDDVYCRHILAGRLPEIIPDTARFPLAAAMPITAAVPIGAHASVPLRMKDGSVYGMFCCLSPRPNESLNTRDLQVMRAFADLAAGHIDADMQGRREKQRKRDAIEALIRESRIEILMQPIFDFASVQPTGFECLSRFPVEPRRSPDQWFNEAGAVGMGVPLELAAIRRSLDLGRMLPDPVYVSVNASAETLMDDGFEAAIAGFPAERLVIELTEHAAVREYAQLSRRLAGIRASGVKLAIDDAGAGYAGLQHIVQLKPDLIKLDMALTRDIDSDQARRALAAALIFYARETGCQIVAEGVETQSEMLTLKTLGIHRGQGYLLGRPMPPEAAAALVGSRRAA